MITSIENQRPPLEARFLLSFSGCDTDTYQHDGFYAAVALEAEGNITPYL